MSSRQFRAGCAAFGLVAATAGIAHAQNDYPAKPVRIIVPTAAGAGLDTLARLVAQNLSGGLIAAACRRKRRDALTHRSFRIPRRRFAFGVLHDPQRALHRRAKADQAVMIERLGGKDAVLSRGAVRISSPPGVPTTRIAAERVRDA